MGYEAREFSKILFWTLLIIIGTFWALSFFFNRPSGEQSQKMELYKENCKVLKIQKEAIDMKIIDNICYLKKEDGSWWEVPAYFRGL
jgi:hypothetical protein